MTIQFFDMIQSSATGLVDNFVGGEPDRGQDAQVFTETFEDKWLSISKRIEARVAGALVQCRRFEAIAAELCQQPVAIDIEMAVAVLGSPDSCGEEAERALVSLALHATAESGRLIDGYAALANSTRLHEFYPIVKIEWEKRYARSQRQQK